MKSWADAGPRGDLVLLHQLAVTKDLSESGPACADAEGRGEVGTSHGKGVMREGEGPGKGHSLSPGSRKPSQGGHAQLAAKEERASDSWRRGGEHCRQRKAGAPTRGAGVCGLGQQ